MLLSLCSSHQTESELQEVAESLFNHQSIRVKEQRRRGSDKHSDEAEKTREQEEEAIK